MHMIFRVLKAGDEKKVTFHLTTFTNLTIFVFDNLYSGICHVLKLLRTQLSPKANEQAPACMGLIRMCENGEG